MIKPMLFGCFAAVTLCGPALAWEVSSDKGLMLYQAAGQGVSVSVVCDPEQVWQPAENHVELTVGGSKPSGEYKVAGGGAEAKVRLDYGMATGADRAAIVKVLRASNKLDVTVEGKSYQLDTGQPLEVACGS